MTKQPSKFGSTIPELTEVIDKYGCGLGKDNPLYVVVGRIISSDGPIGGILAASQNEFYANIICREVNKKGDAKVYQTEFHQNPNFSIAAFKQGLKDKIEAQKLADEQAELSEKIAATPKFKLKIVK
jgi:hypothetical protein